MVGKKLVNQTLIYGLASLLINGSNFFLIPFYTHYLSTSEYGIITTVTVFSSLMTAVLTFGLNSAVTRFYFDFSEVEFKNFLFSVFIFQIISAVAVSVIIIGFNGLFLDSLFSNVSYDPFLRYGIYIGLLAVFANIPLALLQAQSRALLYRILTSLSFIVLTILMIVFIVVLRQGSIGGIKALLLSNAIMAVVYAVFIFRTARIRFKPEYLKIALAFSLPVMVYAIFGVITETSSKFFVERFISLSELGIFNVAQQISSLIVLITNAINMAWIPIFYAEAKTNEKSTLFTDFGNLLIFLLTVIGLVICLYSEELVYVFMSDSYENASIYIPYLILSYIIGSGYWILVINPITFSKKTAYLPMLTILSGLLSVGANLILTPMFGVVGAALSTCVSYIFLVVTAYFVYKRYSAVKYDFRRMNTILMAGIACFAISRVVPLDGFLENIVLKSLLLLVFIWLLAYFKVYSFGNVRNFISSQFTQE